MKCIDQMPAPSDVDANSSQYVRVRPDETRAQRALRRATKAPRQATKYETAEGHPAEVGMVDLTHEELLDGLGEDGRQDRADSSAGNGRSWMAAVPGRGTCGVVVLPGGSLACGAPDNGGQ